jgi:hypothetical protein
MSTGTPLLMTSNTAERARDWSTMARSVAVDGEFDANALIAVADVLRQAQDAAKVHVAFDRGLDAVQLHTSRRGDVRDAGGQAARQRDQQEFNRGRAGVVADEHCRVVGIELEHAHVLMLAAGTAERLDAAAAVGPAHPLIPGAKLEVRERRRPLDGVDRGEEGRRVDAVQRNRLAPGGGCVGLCHGTHSFESQSSDAAPRTSLENGNDWVRAAAPASWPLVWIS